MNIKVLVLTLALLGTCFAQEPTTTMETTTEKVTTMEATTEKATTVEPTTEKATTTMEPTTEKATTMEPTTEKATTTTVPETTTMAAPTTTAVPAVTNKFSVKDVNGTYCLVMEAQLFNITVKCGEEMAHIAVESKDAKTTGECMEKEDTIVISQENMYTLTMIFKMQDTYYQLSNVTADVSSACKAMAARADVNDLRAPKTNVYRCNSQRSIVVNENVTLVLGEVKLQAFRSTNQTDLSAQQYICMEDSTVSNVVPIAVGCALAGLIIIVLIAYVIGRVRRTPYETVQGQ